MTRHILIVGGHGDIGSAVAARSRSAGWLVTSGSSARDASGDTVRLDVRAESSVRDGIAAAERVHGPVDGLVYCAGIRGDAPLIATQTAVWDDVFAVNLRGAMLCIREVLRGMMTRRSGRLVLVGSTAPRHPAAGQAAYAASKAGLQALARAAAVEGGRYGVTCNVITPGPLQSRLFREVKDDVVRHVVSGIALRRLGDAEDVASLAVYLLGDDAGYITGAAMAVDGGYT